MKELIRQYARYNIWANNEFIKLVSSCTEEQLDKELVSSFPTIRKTIYHLWGAEDIWMQRLQLVEHPERAAANFSGSFGEALTQWQDCSQKLLQFIEKQYDDAAFDHVVEYYNPMKKQSMKLPVYVVLMQVLNHATYHRGQLVTMLRQVGIKKIPATDFMIFKKKN